jgi:hypothetical protein
VPTICRVRVGTARRARLCPPYGRSQLIEIGARAYSWLFGYDDEMKVWASQNRPLILLVLGLSGIVYAMYDWLEDPER